MSRKANDIDSLGGVQHFHPHNISSHVSPSLKLAVFFRQASAHRSVPNRNLVYIGIFATLEICFIFDAGSYLASADENAFAGGLSKVAGGFAFAASVLGYYAMVHYLWEEYLPIKVPMGDTSRYFRGRKSR
jgi:hypothetical protein